MLEGYFYPQNTARAAVIRYYDTGLDCSDIERMTEVFGVALDRDAEHDFIWHTHKGEALYPDEMATPHLFYSLRMVFNHVVPPVFRVLGPLERDMKRYNDVRNWSDEYKTAAITELSRELDTRNDLDPELQHQYDDIKLNAALVVALGI